MQSVADILLDPLSVFGAISSKVFTDFVDLWNILVRCFNFLLLLEVDDFGHMLLHLRLLRPSLQLLN